VISLAKQLWTLLVWCSLLTVVPVAAFAQSDSATAKPSVQPRDGQRDFDFEFGTWKTQLSRRLRPLTGSNTWVEYEGTSVVRRVWNGRANLGELEVDGPAGHIEGLSLRLYDPQSRQWKISWANRRDGTLGQPMIGGFRNGRGEFYNQELLDGRAIYVRFIFSDITPNAFRLEQAFSADGGKTWEANWIARFSKVSAQTD
jgi:hypothetical protein